MSAGDVLFVGWTGGDPQYKELAPQVELEPSAGGARVIKRVTINRLCFDKDKQAVVQGLPNGNAVIKSNYVDTDGSVKDQFLGGGYTLISVSNAPVGVGYSRVSAVYQKTVDSAFEIGLPPGLSFTCTNGKCQITYNGTLLEEIDSGTGECTSGIGTFGEIVGFSPYATPTFGLVRPDTTSVVNQVENYDPAPLLDQPYYLFSVTCNDVVCDEITVVGRDLKPIRVQGRANYSTVVRSPSYDNLNDLRAWEEENAISQEEISLILSEYESQYPSLENAENKFFFRRERQFFRNFSTELVPADQPVVPTDSETGETTEVFLVEKTVYSYSVVYTDIVSRLATYQFPRNLQERFIGSSRQGQFIEPTSSIVKTGNIIQFRLNHPYFKQPVVWREYDVTGL